MIWQDGTSIRIHWRRFRVEVEALLRDCGAKYLIKEDLKRFV